MCWDEKTSWVTFIIGTSFNIFNIYYFKNTTITIISMIWQWVLLMQLFDAMAWRSMANGDKKTNRIAANGAMIVNITQPIMVAFLLLLITPVQTLNKAIVLVCVFIYICWLLYSLNSNEEFNTLQPSERCENLDYVWWRKFPGKATLYMITLLASVFLLLKPTSLALFESGYIVITLAISALFYSCGTASVWCWFAAFAPIATGLWWKFYEN